MKNSKVEEVHASPTFALTETSLHDHLDVSSHENLTRSFEGCNDAQSLPPVTSSWRKKCFYLLVGVLALLAFIFIATLAIDVYVKQEVWKKDTANQFVLYDEQLSNLSTEINQVTKQLHLLMEACKSSLESSFETKLNTTTQKLTSHMSDLLVQAQLQYDSLNEKIWSMNESMTSEAFYLNFTSQKKFKEVNAHVGVVNNSLINLQHSLDAKEKLLNDSLTSYVTHYQTSLQQQVDTNSNFSSQIAIQQMELQSFMNDSNSRIGLLNQNITFTRKAVDTQARLVSSLIQAHSLMLSNISSFDSKIDIIQGDVKVLSSQMLLLNMTLENNNVNISSLASTLNTIKATMNCFENLLSDTNNSVFSNQMDLNFLRNMHNSMAQNLEVISVNLSGLQAEVLFVVHQITRLNSGHNESTDLLAQLQWDLATTLTTQKELEAAITLLNKTSITQ